MDKLKMIKKTKRGEEDTTIKGEKGQEVNTREGEEITATNKVKAREKARRDFLKRGHTTRENTKKRTQILNLKTRNLLQAPCNQLQSPDNSKEKK